MKRFTLSAIFISLLSVGANSNEVDIYPWDSKVTDTERMVKDRRVELKAISDAEKGFERGAEEVVEKDTTKAVELMRIKAISGLGMSYGMQAGLSYRYGQIVELIESGKLANLSVLNFHPFIQDEVILMPSLEVITQHTKIENSTLYRSNVAYVVNQEARIVMAPPSYIDYLIKSFEPPKPIHVAMRPSTKNEKTAWREAVHEGWAKGVQQANEIFDDAVKRLVRDINGRVKYLELLELGIVKPATLKVTNNSVSFDGREQRVGEKIYEIESVVTFKNIEDAKTAWER